MTWGSNPEPDPPLMAWWEWIPAVFVALFIVLMALAALGHHC